MKNCTHAGVLFSVAAGPQKTSHARADSKFGIDSFNTARLRLQRTMPLSPSSRRSRSAISSSLFPSSSLFILMYGNTDFNMFLNPPPSSPFGEMMATRVMKVMGNDEENVILVKGGYQWPQNRHCDHFCFVVVLVGSSSSSSVIFIGSHHHYSCSSTSSPF